MSDLICYNDKKFFIFGKLFLGNSGKMGCPMQTKTKYEELVLKELRGIPGESLPQVLKIIRSLKEGFSAAKDASQRGMRQESGLCGIWQDDRSANEIIKMIHAHRTGFGGRGVDL